MSMIKVVRAKDGKTVWITADKLDNVIYTTAGKAAKAPKPKARKKNAKSE
jgi:hypothetical protein